MGSSPSASSGSPVLGRSDLLGLLARHGVRPSRALGQNFVVDPNTVRRIARLAEVGAPDHVVEIGAGAGSLTVALAATGARVTAIELDRRLVGALREVVEGTDVRVVEGDALRLDWNAVLEGAAEWVLVANLPYNIATPLILDLLGRVSVVRRMLVMVQKEVGERLAAQPRSAAYGAVSVKVAYWGHARVVGRVPPSVFVPRPKVESVLIAISRHADGPAVGAVTREQLFSVVEAGFATRRKMLRRALRGTVSEGCFAEAGVRPDQRAEELDLAAWGRLAECAAK